MPTNLTSPPKGRPPFLLDNKPCPSRSLTECITARATAAARILVSVDVTKGPSDRDQAYTLMTARRRHLLQPCGGDPWRSRFSSERKRARRVRGPPLHHQLSRPEVQLPLFGLSHEHRQNKHVCKVLLDIHVEFEGKGIVGRQNASLARFTYWTKR